jgi:hypothetical protein
MVNLKIMIDFKIIFICLSVSLLSFWTVRNSTLGMIKRIGYNSRYYPKFYKNPSKWMKKIFALKNNPIPMFLYVELYISIAFVAIGPINAIISLIDYNREVVGIIFITHMCLIIGDTIFLLIMSMVYQK